MAKGSVYIDNQTYENAEWDKEDITCQLYNFAENKAGFVSFKTKGKGVIVFLTLDLHTSIKFEEE